RLSYNSPWVYMVKLRLSVSIYYEIGFHDESLAKTTLSPSVVASLKNLAQCLIQRFSRSELACLHLLACILFRFALRI
ncbi:hypothetical protein ACJX0J_038337, partial [Zea mays]